MSCSFVSNDEISWVVRKGAREDGGWGVGGRGRGEKREKTPGEVKEWARGEKTGKPGKTEEEKVGGG